MKCPTLFMLLLTLLLPSCGDDDPTQPDGNPFLITPGERTLVIAHRGGRDLAPENTLAAFDTAVGLEVDVLEMDLALTKDSVLVTIHDLAVDRTSDTTGLVIDFTYQELQEFNFGYNFEDDNGNYPYRSNAVKIPRIEEVFARYPNELMMIEVKDQGETGIAAARKLNALIVANNLQKQVAVFSFSDAVKGEFPNIIHEDIQIGASLLDGFQFVEAANAANDSLISSLPLNLFAFPMEFGGIDLADPVLIEAAHRNDLSIHYWTINKKEDMETLISKGVDGIMTDKPDLLINTLRDLGWE